MKTEFESKRDEVRGFVNALFAYQGNELIGPIVEQAKCIIEERSRDARLSIALCGQYSSGKSTLAIAMTGIKSIATGDGVTTAACTPYECEDFLLVDTPGIYAGHPDHDQMSLDFYKKADLLIYLCTPTGIRKHVKEDFRRLIVEKYRSKTMLVLNQLSEEDEANEPQWRADIASIADGDMGILDELRFSVLDVKMYLDACGDRDAIEYSRYELFKKNFDGFVRAKGLYARLLSQTDVVLSTIDECASVCADVKSRDEKTRRRLTALDSSISIIEKAFKDSTVKAERNLSSLHEELMSLATKELIPEFCEKIKNLEIEIRSAVADESFPEKISAAVESVFKDFEDIDITCFGEQKSETGDWSKLLDEAGKIPKQFCPADMGWIREGADKIVKMLSGLSKELVVDVVHFFGGKFKPHGANKLMSGLKKAGFWIQCATEALDFAVDKVLDVQIEKARKRMDEAFPEMIRKVKTQFDVMRESKNSAYSQLRSLRKSILDEDDKRRALNAEKTSLRAKLELLRNDIISFRRSLAVVPS